MRLVARLCLAVLAIVASTAALAQQLTTNFDDITTLPGAGWVFTNNSAPAGSTTWFQGNSAVFTSQAGAADSYIAANFNAAALGGNISLWALTPVLPNLQNGEILTFFTRTETGSPFPDRLEVRVSTNGASTNVGATDATVGDFTLLLTAVNPTLATGGYPEVWTQVTVTLAGLPPGVNSGRIGFRYFVADTSVNGDYIGIDTLNLTDGPPDLTVTKTHVGNFAQGQVGASYAITVANSGGLPTAGTVTMVDTLPVGLTATGLSGPGWACVLATLTCTRGDALNGGASYPPITLVVDVAAGAPGSVTNIATVSGGGESDATNDTANDLTTINAVAGADLTIAKSHVGNFTQGQVGAAYTITVTNGGGLPTVGTVTVVDTLPVGLTATGLSGTGWACVVGTLTCTRGDALAGGASYPGITLTVDVSNTAPASVTNIATVSGGGEVNVGNDTANDITAIGGAPDLTVSTTHAGNFTQGQVGAVYTVTVTNVGTAPTSGTVTVIDTPSAGLTATAIAGPGWACVLATLTCTRSDPLAAGASYPAITLTVNVSATAPASACTSVTVSGGGQSNVANDTSNDPTVVAPAAGALVTPVPTLDPRALLAMSMLLVLLGWAGLRRRNR
ncbi:MAG: IPTL-CTERM sorting domain-containing protein [Casimicrobiaceae bacterium]